MSVKALVCSLTLKQTGIITDAKTGKQKTLVMVKSPNYDTDYTWKAALPSGVLTNIIFNRYSPTEKTVWNAWYTQPGVNNMYTDQIV